MPSCHCLSPICSCRYGYFGCVEPRPPINFIGYSHPITLPIETYIEKKPHTCPVCQGKGQSWFDHENNLGKYIANCHPCQGKGIVWQS